MAKPLNQFGGWLRFLEIGLFLSLFLGLVALAFIFGSRYMYDQSMFVKNDWAKLFLLAGLVLTALILHNLRIQSPSTPALIRKLLIVNCVVSFSGSFVSSVVSSGGKPSSSAGSIILTTFIWWQYFRVSQRVKAFYGNN